MVIPKNILFISSSSGLGGAEQCLLNMASRLVKEHNVFILMPSKGPLESKIEQIGAKGIIYYFEKWVLFKGDYNIKNIIKFWLRLPENVSYLAQIIRSREIDIVYTNTLMCIAGAIAAKTRRIPHVWHIHENLFGNPGICSCLPKRIITFLIEKLSSVVVAPSDAAKKRFNSKSGKIRVIYNGVDINKYNTGMNLDAKVDSMMNFRIAMIGTISERKGSFDVVEAVKIIDRSIKNISYYVVGKGKDKAVNRMRQKIAEAGLSEKFVFMGFVDKIEDVINEIDLLICPSWSESFSLVTVEAMAAGKPVVATRCGGPEEIVEDGVTGLLVPVRSPRDLAKAVINIISDPHKAKGMGDMGKKRISETFNVNNFTNSISEMVECL